MNEQQEAWAGDFGNEYTKRNRVNWPLRVPFWTEILAMTGANSILEVGCNYGANLLALRAVGGSVLSLSGLEINMAAAIQARRLGFSVIMGTIQDNYYPGGVNLVFTAGMLIHVPPVDLQDTMRRIYDSTTRCVLAIEYDSQAEEEITYRGKTGLLWKRPYGQLYQDLGCRELASGYLKPEDGFDNCTWWLMEKQ